jgi:hypothetical protein
MQLKVLGERPEKRDIVQIEEYSSAETIEELTKINALILRAEEQGQAKRPTSLHVSPTISSSSEPPD